MIEGIIHSYFFMQERAFLRNLTHFTYPLWRNKVVTLKSIIMYCVWSFWPIGHVFFIQRIISVLENSDKEAFIQTMFYYGVYIILMEVAEYIVRKWWRVENVNIYRRTIQEDVIPAFSRLSNNSTETIGTGKLISIMEKGIDVWAISLNQILENVTRNLVVFFFAIYMIIQFDYRYAVIFIFLYIGIHIVWQYFNSKSLIYRRKRQVYWNEYVRRIVRIIMNKFEILQTQKIDYEIQRLHQISNSLYKNTFTMAGYIHWFFRIAEWGVVWFRFFVILYLWFLVVDGERSISILVGVFGILILMDGSIERSMKFFKDFTKGFSTIEKMWNLLENTPQIQGYETWKTFKHKAGEISIKNLSYGYDSNNPVFTDLSLNISGSKVTALVWPSGGGKSTLVKLIAGYVRQDEGNILVDIQNLKEVSLKSYYADVWYLTQEPSVFDGTVKENLLYAVKKDPTKKELEETISQAHCKFIYDLPNGLDTEIGERGVKLSGWQKQRLAIAKIFLKNPKIIILDEPTSALDSHSEQKITEAMHNLFQWRTVIIIAHRLQTVKHADDIIVIDNGEVIERGTHTSLIKKDGYYKEMLDLQSGF